MAKSERQQWPAGRGRRGLWGPASSPAHASALSGGRALGPLRFPRGGHLGTCQKCTSLSAQPVGSAALSVGPTILSAQAPRSGGHRSQGHQMGDVARDAPSCMATAHRNSPVKGPVTLTLGHRTLLVPNFCRLPTGGVGKHRPPPHQGSQWQPLSARCRAPHWGHRVGKRAPVVPVAWKISLAL